MSESASIVLKNRSLTNVERSRIGILGGTFNPVHYGHLRVGIEISERTGLDKIMLMPNYLPPHRDAPKVSAQDRLMMCCLAAKSNKLFTVSDIEIKQKKLSYTLHTCQQLVEQYPEASFSFITGSDSLVKSVWYRFDDILELLEHFYVIHRPGVDLEELKNKLAEMNLRNAYKMVWFEAPGLDISSTYIRKILSEGRSAQYLVPDSVLEYIRVRSLF